MADTIDMEERLGFLEIHVIDLIKMISILNDKLLLEPKIVDSFMLHQVNLAYSSTYISEER